MHAARTTSQWETLIEKYSEVSAYPGIYVLGSFARCVTLYSQQVRAFNLIFGLYKMGKLKTGLRIGVLGAGAAGLTAAAALSYLSKFHNLDLDVSLLEETDGPLRMQYNAHHRWIHPHIYDWPNQHTLGDRSQLPIFNWKAGPASDVVKQIENAWTHHSKGVNTSFSVSKVDLTRKNGYMLKWDDAGGRPVRKTIDILIVAIGFGLEPEAISSMSYWSGDDLDDAFHKGRDGQRWLISGSGDGALTDLMRLCIDSFRLDDIVSLLDTFDGRQGLIRDIETIYANPDASDEQISKDFHSLSTGDLPGLLRPKLRKRGPEVFLTARSSHIYGSKSSVLNRLIVLLLARAGGFIFLPGPSGEPREDHDNRRKYRVELGYPGHVMDFDRVISRHGTDQELIKETMKHLMDENACDHLLESWKALKPHADETRFKMWDDDFFGPENTLDRLEATSHSRAHAERDKSFDEAAQLFGVKLAQFSSYKDLQPNGQSLITYEFEGLQALSRNVEGIHFTYDSVVGKVGSPVFDSTQKTRYGLEWEPDKEKVCHSDQMMELRRQLARFSGTIKFGKPLTPSDPPMNFTMKIDVLNGDALNAWEFDQLYTESERVHIDTKRLRHPLEFFSRIVSCPIETVRIQVTLPKGISGKPAMNVFRLPTTSQITPEEVMQDSVLRFYPRRESACHPDQGAWETYSESQGEFIHFRNPSSQTWELTVAKPTVGTCYSIDWKLPDAKLDAETQEAANKAAEFRGKLLQYREARRTGAPFPQKKSLQALLKSLYANLKKLRDEMGAKEEFDLALMVYDDLKRAVWFADGIQDGMAPRKEHYDFHFPFGLGLAGACMKQADRTFMYLGSANSPEYYLKVPGLERHHALAAIPILNPEWYPTGASEIAETSRMCFAVINVSFKKKTRWLAQVQCNDNRMNSLRSHCQNFGDSLWDILK